MCIVESEELSWEEVYKTNKIFETVISDQVWLVNLSSDWMRPGLYQE